MRARNSWLAALAGEAMERTHYHEAEAMKRSHRKTWPVLRRRRRQRCLYTNFRVPSQCENLPENHTILATTTSNPPYSDKPYVRFGLQIARLSSGGLI